MNPTKFYNLDNSTLLQSSLYHKQMDYVRPRNRRRSQIGWVAPAALGVALLVGYSLMKIVGG